MPLNDVRRIKNRII